MEALTFANLFTNVDQDFYKNAKLKVTWNPYVNTESGASVTAGTAPGRPKEISRLMTIGVGSVKRPRI